MCKNSEVNYFTFVSLIADNMVQKMNIYVKQASLAKNVRNRRKIQKQVTPEVFEGRVSF